MTFFYWLKVMYIGTRAITKGRFQHLQDPQYVTYNLGIG